MSLFLISVISAAVIYGVASTLSKHFMDLDIEDHVFAGSIFGTPFFLLLFSMGLLKGEFIMAKDIAVSGFLAGALYSIVLILYMRGLGEQEVSRFVPALSLNTLFVALISFVFLDQVFTGREYLGMVMTVAGAVLISLEDPLESFREFSSVRGVQIAIITAFLIGVRDSLLEFVTADFSLWSALIWAGIGGICFSISSIMFLRTEKLNYQSLRERKDMFGVGSLRAVGFLAYTFAISLGPAAKASAIVKINGILVVFFAAIISRNRPEFIEEETQKRKVVQKIFAAMIIISGAILTAY